MSTTGLALEMFKTYEHFTKCLLDAFAVIDASGRVIKCSPLFSQLTRIKTKQILKAESLDEILSFSVAGKPLTTTAILQNTGPTRIDEVQGKNIEGEELNLIIGVYPFIQNETCHGAFLLVRDVTAETNLQGKYKDKATQSITDALTGLFNRAYFVDYMAAQVSTLEGFPYDAPQRTMSVVMCDIDFFKKINDTHGHQAGDYIIKMVADLIKRSFRKTDIVCRYGGEEFLAILPGTDYVGALVAAEKLRLSIQNFRFTFEGTAIPVTMSSGVAQVNINRESGDQAIARADAALYFSKENGRNRVSLHDGTNPVSPQSLSPALAAL